jgi:pimeloyl-ACP methyl ester carboxylesterase
MKVERIPVGDVTLEVRLAGPADGPPLLLLHGFPECWWAWRNQFDRLVAAGYRLIVPHQRGYGQSDKPKGIHSYRLDLLIADLAGLLDALGYRKVRVAAHDWGAIVGWWLAHHRPDLVARQVLLSGPHPDVLRRAIRRPPQMFKSWYIWSFQAPWIPEFVVGNRRLKTLEWIVDTGVYPYPPDDIAVFRTQWAIPGTVHAQVNWYRALLRSKNAPPPPGPIKPPTLVLWGAADKALGTETAEQSAALCDDGRVEVIPGVGHWLPHEAPDVVTDRLLTFFGET